VVPLLLTTAYHHRVDLPAVLAEARAGGLRLPVAVTGGLGPVRGEVPAPLLAALWRRLAELRTGFDAVLLAAAGTRDPAARASVDAVAAALGELLGVACRAGYASAAAPTVANAVGRLRADGGRRVAAAAYFLAPGRLYAAAADSARAAGAVAVAAPLGAALEVAQLVLARLDAANRLAAREPSSVRTAWCGREAERPGRRLRGVELLWRSAGLRMSGREGGSRCGA
jgi:sirohydrochlorin ferrochelatase